MTFGEAISSGDGDTLRANWLMGDIGRAWWLGLLLWLPPLLSCAPIAVGLWPPPNCGRPAPIAELLLYPDEAEGDVAGW